MKVIDLEKPQLQLLANLVLNQLEGNPDITMMITERIENTTKVKFISTLKNEVCADLIGKQLNIMRSVPKSPADGITIEGDDLKYDIQVTCKSSLVCNIHTQYSRIDATRVILKAPAAIYPPLRDQNGELTPMGFRVATNVLVDGISDQIHHAHNTGQWDSAEHLRYIIDRLEQLFVVQSKTTYETQE